MRCKPLCMEGFAPYAGDGVVETPRPCFYASTTLSTLFPGLQPLWGRFLFCVAECRDRRKGAFRLPLFFAAAVGDEPFGLLPAVGFPPLRGPLAGSYFEGAVPLFQKGPRVKASFPPLLVTWAATWYNKAALLTKSLSRN